MNRSLRRGIATLSVIAACAAAAATALAGAGSSTVKDTESLPIGVGNTQVGSAKATCPKGTLPAPAGLSVSDGANSTVLGLSTSGRVVKAKLGNYSVASHTITSIAYCSHTGGVKVRSATIRSGSSAKQRVTASCKDDERLLYGGFKLPSTTDIYLSSLKKKGQSKWIVGVLSFQSGQKVKAYAYCSQDAPRTTTKSKSYTVPDEQTASATPKCPKGKVAIGGGYKSQVTVSDEFGLLRGFERAGRGWKTTVRDDNGEIRPPKVTAYAYCA